MIVLVKILKGIAFFLNLQKKTNTIIAGYVCTYWLYFGKE